MNKVKLVITFEYSDGGERATALDIMGRVKDEARERARKAGIVSTENIDLVKDHGAF